MVLVDAIKETLIKNKKMAIKINSDSWFDTKKVVNPPIGTKVDFMTKHGNFYYGEIINRHSVGVFYVAGFGYFEDSIVEKWKYSKQ